MDDELILNLAQDEIHPTIKSSVNKRGGRWTQRLKAKRFAKKKPQPTTTFYPDNAEEVPSEGEERKQKRRRVEKPTAGPKHIVSSLFTNNPKIDIPTSDRLMLRCSIKPSNAPLNSSTFAGLGLNPLLIAHLTNKMNISKPTSIQCSVLSILLSSDAELSSRDAFIQSQTGSGKTLSFLLPIIQDLLPLSSLSYIDRSIGTLAIIIVPTRELAKQISDVLDTLLKMRLRNETESSEDNVEFTNRMTRWLISGVLTGGATRNHEKARLRKGVPILVSTPGRLLDHIQNTLSFNVGKCRWLILDEADRLMELGFEETINGILDGLDSRKRLAIQAMQQEKGMEVGNWEWRRRRTVLCSATIREDVQKLAGRALFKPLMIKATATDQTSSKQSSALVGGNEIAKENFTPPAQLTQRYLIVPLKLRLVTLVALLRILLAQSVSKDGTKIIVFFSCTDSVDFHWNMFGRATMEVARNSLGEDKDKNKAMAVDDTTQHEEVETTCSLLPDVCIYRLHGSLSTHSRQKSLHKFVKSQGTLKSSSILFCTSVASRGLDLPLVRAVVQYDLPTEGGATEYIHRVGRTARAGKGGETWCFVAPNENDWIKWINAHIHTDGGSDYTEAESGNLALASSPLETILKKGFGGKGQQYESRATQVQVAFERWVLQNEKNVALARDAYLSHLRAYATHPSNEKHIFHVKHLHLGHLAKAFALRDAPTSVASAKAKKQRVADGMRKLEKGPIMSVNLLNGERSHNYVGDTEKRMQEVVRAQGKLTKKSGMTVSSGASEFQIAGGEALERMVQGS